MLKEYSLTKEGLWLQVLKYKDFDFYWCNGLEMDRTGIIGCFSPLFPKRIFMAPFDSGIEIEPDCRMAKEHEEEERVFWIEGNFPTYVHELRHAYQWKKSKLLYILCALPIIREFTLEKDANAKQKETHSFIEAFTSKEDYKYAAKNGLIDKEFEDAVSCKND